MKIIELDGPDSVLSKLAECLSHYANAAYPPGASECALAARAALLDAAESIKQQIEKNNFPVTVSRRLKTNIKAALSYCAEEDNNDSQYALLIKIMSGEVVAADEWEK